MFMTFDHLELLLSKSKKDSPEDDNRLIDEWDKVPFVTSADLRNANKHTFEQVGGVDGGVSTVLSSYPCMNEGLAAKLLSPPLGTGLFITRILRVGPILEPLDSILSSGQPLDAVQNDIVELIGFENIELAMDIIANLDLVKSELHGHLSVTSSADSKSFTPTKGGEGAKGNIGSSRRPRILSADEAYQSREIQLAQNASRPLFLGKAEPEPEKLPHVYSSAVSGTVLSDMGSKYLLPIGTVRRDEAEYEEVIIPPAKPVPPRSGEILIPVQTLDSLAKGCFPGYQTLNRIQSILYPTAYESNENLLVCAPTGAGKTDVAMLTVLRVLKLHLKEPEKPSTIKKDEFKIIYVAPMKALAAEIVRKLSKRLKWLSISVRELTGDMQLTKQEISETQIIVTTPEKWDVVTRKPTGEGELASLLKLLIIDEVHLLNEERGAVIETIVARTLRQVESTQSLIRIVGLSATLPNYVDVATFLSASHYKGLFYFDSSFRPIPLEQHFIGIRGKPGSPQARKNLDKVTFRKVSDLVAEGHQVMVFVHARRETVKSALALQEMALAEGNLDDFSCQELPQWDHFRREIGESRNKEMRQLFDNGFGIHHAGMLRSDRNLMERLFESKAIKVLCCTATLAWGVNLPAHAVVIKGTQIYDSAKGSFVDLSVLDVLQIFGRAGRPGLETSGEGYICTTEDKLDHYLDLVTSQHPIESQFQGGLVDALNAEIALGTVAGVADGVKWLGYTYLFVRMRKNPFVYGIGWDTLADDPQLGSKRRELVLYAAEKLAITSMIVFDRQRGTFMTTSLGRIAAKYYIRHASIEIFNEKFHPTMSEADVLLMLSKSAEFNDVQFRESEVDELKKLLEIVPCEVKGIDDSQDKINILLQAYISRVVLEDFALVSDSAFVAQNGGRILRALLEIAISKKWSSVSTVLMGLSKAVEKRMWPTAHPLSAFALKPELLYNLDKWAVDWGVADLAEKSAAELGKLVHLNEHHGHALLTAAKQFPTLEMSYVLRPLGHDILRIDVRIGRAFSWNARYHGAVEPFWVWVEDHEGINIHQSAYILIRSSTTLINLEFTISIPNGQPPSSVTIRSISDRWLGAEEEQEVPLDALVMPTKPDFHSSPLDLPYLNTSVFKVPNHFANGLILFNNIQTQSFWSIIQTKMNALLCAPTGCGKSTLVHVLAWSMLRKSEGWLLIITPQKSTVQETRSSLLPFVKGTNVTLLHGPTDWSTPRGRVIQIVTADQLLGCFTRHTEEQNFEQLNLVICENLEGLTDIYELALSLLRHKTQSLPTRFVGLSNSLLDCTDLADWLDVDPRALNSFRPRDRDQPLTFIIQTFTIPHSTSLFKAMIKPAHATIQNTPQDEGTIIFVPSRSHCRSVARDLIKQNAIETETNKGYLATDFNEQNLEFLMEKLQNRDLLEFISRGVGFFHEGIPKHDRILVLELFAEGIVRVLIVPRDSCWNLPVRANVVVTLGTQYMSGDGVDRQLREYELTELARMQGRAVRHNGPGQFHLFCQAEAKDTYARFLNDGLPLESALLESRELSKLMLSRKQSGGPLSKQDLVDILSFTFLSRRMLSNPVYYANQSGSLSEGLSRIADTISDDASLIEASSEQ